MVTPAAGGLPGAALPQRAAHRGRPLPASRTPGARGRPGAAPRSRSSGVGRDDRRDLRPPPLRLPRGSARRAHVVGALHGRATCRSRTAAGAAPGARWRSDGRPLGDVGRPHDSATRAAPTPATRTDTCWWSPRLALPLRWTIDMRHRRDREPRHDRATLELRARPSPDRSRATVPSRDLEGPPHPCYRSRAARPAVPVRSKKGLRAHDQPAGPQGPHAQVLQASRPPRSAARRRSAASARGSTRRRPRSRTRRFARWRACG